MKHKPDTDVRCECCGLGLQLSAAKYDRDLEAFVCKPCYADLLDSQATLEAIGCAPSYWWKMDHGRVIRIDKETGI